MPLYEYQCEKCGQFELIRKFSDPTLDKCPTCGGPVEKLLSPPAIQFKGTGWYITDYARKGSSGGGKSEGQSESGKSESKESSSSTATKTDSSSSGGGSSKS